MKKLMVSLLLAGVIVAAFGFVSTANAQGPVDQPFYGQGGGRGRFDATSVDHVENEDVHNLMMELYSAELGISVEELESREAAGETMSQIVLSTGLSFEEFRALKTAVNTSVAEQALAAGYIDQTQYAWLIQAAERQMSGFGNGTRIGTTNGTPLGTGPGTGYSAADGTFNGRGSGLVDGTGTGYGMRRGSGQLGTGVGTGDCTVQP